MTNVLDFTSPHACYMCLLISCQSSSYSFLRRLRPRPLYPQLLFSRRLLDSRPGLDTLKGKCTAPSLTSNHGPSLYLLSYPDSTFPLFWSKYFPRCVFLKHLLTPVRHLPHKCCLFAVFMFLCTFHRRYVTVMSNTSQLPELAVLIPPGTFTLTRTLSRSFRSAWVQCSSGETAGQHLAPTLSRLGPPSGGREKQQ